MNTFHAFLDECAANILALRALEEPFNAAVEKVAQCLLDGGKLLACGNGGSASDSSHLVSEFVIRFVEDRKSYPALALAGDGGMLTAGANDYGFEEVFARQVSGLGKPGDVLIVFTTSGKSPNILRALEAAREGGLVSIAFLGRGGGPAKGKADVELIVPGTEATARIQEAHKVLLHRLCEQVEKLVPRW